MDDSAEMIDVLDDEKLFPHGRRRHREQRCGPQGAESGAREGQNEAPRARSLAQERDRTAAAWASRVSALTRATSMSVTADGSDPAAAPYQSVRARRGLNARRSERSCSGVIKSCALLESIHDRSCSTQ